MRRRRADVLHRVHRGFGPPRGAGCVILDDLPAVLGGLLVGVGVDVDTFNVDSSNKIVFEYSDSDSVSTVTFLPFSSIP